MGYIGVKGRMRYVLNVINAHLGMSGDGGGHPLLGTHLAGAWRGRTSACLSKTRPTARRSSNASRPMLPGVIAVNPEGGKLARFMAMQPEWEAGDWYVDRNAAWTRP